MNLLAKRESEIPPELERVFPGAEEFFRDIFGFIPRQCRWMLRDLQVRENEVTLQLVCPGHKPEDFDVEIAGRLLTVKTCCRCEERHGDAKRHYLFKERSCMNLEESFHLPVEVAASGAKASYDEGILHISLPREIPQTPQCRKIEVNCAE